MGAQKEAKAEDPKSETQVKEEKREVEQEPPAIVDQVHMVTQERADQTVLEDDPQQPESNQVAPEGGYDIEDTSVQDGGPDQSQIARTFKMKKQIEGGQCKYESRSDLDEIQGKLNPPPPQVSQLLMESPAPIDAQADQDASLAARDINDDQEPERQNQENEDAAKNQTNQLHVRIEEQAQESDPVSNTYQTQ